jgi:hypothetical protein
MLTVKFCFDAYEGSLISNIYGVPISYSAKNAKKELSHLIKDNVFIQIINERELELDTLAGLLIVFIRD